MGFKTFSHVDAHVESCTKVIWDDPDGNTSYIVRVFRFGTRGNSNDWLSPKRAKNGGSFTGQMTRH